VYGNARSKPENCTLLFSPAPFASTCMTAGKSSGSPDPTRVSSSAVDVSVAVVVVPVEGWLYKALKWVQVGNVELGLEVIVMMKFDTFVCLGFLVELRKMSLEKGLGSGPYHSHNHGYRL
ncbi:hypothetical protein HID58_007475, partial [Brassica napus]